MDMIDSKDIRPVCCETRSDVVICVESLWKQYRLGAVNHGTLTGDVQSWWARLRGKQDPNLRIDHLAHQAPDSEHGPQSDRFWALKDISFDIIQGQAIGIIGRNGAGKSTLLKIMSRVTTPTRGIVKIRGRVSSLLEVGTGFHPELTGRENIFLNGAIHGMTKTEIRSKFDEIVAFSEVEKFIDTPVKRYSSGMYVRLAFAVAAHLEPEILIVDEVLAVGDIAFQKKCLGKMEEVGSEGRTVLFVSHQLNMVESLCSETIILKDGLLYKRGKTKEIIADYMKNMCDEVDHYQNLLSIEERRGSQKIQIRSFHIEDTDGNVWESLMTGMDAIFVVGFECQDDSILDNVDIGISFHSIVNNQAFAILYASYVGSTFTVNKKQGFFRCTIKQFPLVEGRYKLNVRITVNGFEADFPLNGVRILDVVPGDFYGTGSRGFGVGPQFLVDGRWEIEQA